MIWALHISVGLEQEMFQAVAPTGPGDCPYGKVANVNFTSGYASTLHSKQNEFRYCPLNEVDI